MGNQVTDSADEYDLIIHIDTVDPEILSRNGWYVRVNHSISKRLNERLKRILEDGDKQLLPASRGGGGGSSSSSGSGGSRRGSHNGSGSSSSGSGGEGNRISLGTYPVIPPTAPNSRNSSRPSSTTNSRPPSPLSSYFTDEVTLSSGDSTPRDITDNLDLVSEYGSYPPKLGHHLLSNVEPSHSMSSTSSSPPVKSSPIGTSGEVPAAMLHTSRLQQHQTNNIAKEHVNYFTELEDAFSRSPHCIVGVIGKCKTGKTHVLNMISGSSLHESHYSHTEGICFKIPPMNQGRDYLLIDSLGYDSGIKKSVIQYYAGKSRNIKNSDWPIRRAILDQKCVEGLVQDAVFNMCHCLLFIVNGDMSYQDQYLLHQLLKKKYIHQPQNSPTIIVVHNFSNTFTLSQFNHKVHSNAIDLFEGELRTREVQGGLAPFFAGECNHVFLGNEDSECGRRYNELSYRLIQTWLASRKSERIPSIRDYISSILNLCLRKYLNNIKGVSLNFCKRQDNSNDPFAKYKKKAAKKVASSSAWFNNRSKVNEESSHIGDFVVQVTTAEEEQNRLVLNKVLKTDLFGLSILQNKV
jgi:hypothetical protein